MVKAIFYQEADGTCPVLEFLRHAPLSAQATARRRLELLKQEGHGLRRPHAAYLRDGVYELRWRWQRVNYRVLYSFHGKAAVVLTNALTKEDVVPPTEINRAISRKKLFEANPQKHTYQGEAL